MAVWNGKNVAILFGVIPLSSIGGYGEKDILTLEPTQDAFTFKETADGNPIWSATNSQGMKGSLTLSQTSKCNVLLSGLLALDMSQQNGAGILPFTATDLGGTTVISMSLARIMKRPKLTWTVDVSEVVWEITGYCEVYILGGN